MSLFSNAVNATSSIAVYVRLVINYYHFLFKQKQINPLLSQGIHQNMPCQQVSSLTARHSSQNFAKIVNRRKSVPAELVSSTLVISERIYCAACKSDYTTGYFQKHLMTMKHKKAVDANRLIQNSE